MFEWFSKKAVSEIDPPKPSRNPMRALSAIMFNFGMPTKSVSHENAMAAKLAMQHPITYRCIDKIGTSFQTIGWYIEKDPEATASAQLAYTDDKAAELTQILRRPSAGFSAVQLKYWLAITWACFGRATLKVSVMNNGTINGIFPLRESAVEAITDKNGIVTKIQYGGKTGQTMPSQAAARRVGGVIVESYAVQMYKPSLDAMYSLDKANTPLGAIGLPAQIFNALLQRAHETATGQPNTRIVITSDSPIERTDQNDLSDELDERQVGGDKSGNVLTISGLNAKVTELKNDLSDIHSKIPLDDSSRMIAGNFGIPVALLGFASADGGKFANNFIESRRSFFEDTLIPGYCSPIEEGITMGVLPPGYRLRFDRDNIPAIMEARALTAKAWNDVEFITRDEKREVMGWEKDTVGDNQAQ